MTNSTTCTSDAVVNNKYVRNLSSNKDEILTKTKDKKLRGSLKRKEKHFEIAAKNATRAEILQTQAKGHLEAEGMEKTYKFTQVELKAAVDVQTARKQFDLSLTPLGPYRIQYTHNGRHVVLAGKKGHIAQMDTLRMTVETEFHVNETVRDVVHLHNHTFIAVAQHKFTYIYDNTGAEVHCLRDLTAPQKLSFLPHHFLLATMGHGVMNYRDTSTGKIVVQHRTKLGHCHSFTQNPWNAVMHIGNAAGVVSLWTPNFTSAAVKMQCHRGPVESMAIHANGHYMVTSGVDRLVKLWDLRTYQELYSYQMTSPGTSVDVSQEGLLAVGFGPNVQVWKDVWSSKQQSPYLTHRPGGTTSPHVRFQPFEDIVAVGHSKGFSQLIVPGAGTAALDTYAANPYQSSKQRRETEVRSLLEKLRPEMITLSPDRIGQVTRPAEQVLVDGKKVAFAANHPGKEKEPPRIKNKKRGRGKISNRLRNKQRNVLDEERIKQQAQQKEKKQDKTAPELPKTTCLTRFKARE